MEDGMRARALPDLRAALSPHFPRPLTIFDAVRILQENDAVWAVALEHRTVPSDTSPTLGIRWDGPQRIKVFAYLRKVGSRSIHHLIETALREIGAHPINKVGARHCALEFRTSENEGSIDVFVSAWVTMPDSFVTMLAHPRSLAEEQMESFFEFFDSSMDRVSVCASQIHNLRCDLKSVPRQ